MANLVGIAAIILSAQFDLGQWGLSSVDEIGYVNVGLLHDAKGDRLVVYEVRKTPPSKLPAEAPQFRDPAPHGSSFVVSRFEKGNRNALNGFFNVFSRAPAKAKLAIDSVGKNSGSLNFAYEKPENTFAGFWIHLFDSRKPREERVYFDSSGYEFITLAVRGEKGGENIALNVMDHTLEAKEDSKRIGLIGEFLPSGMLTSSWQTAIIPLSRILPSVNRKSLAGLSFEVMDETRAGRIFVKDLIFSRAKDAVVAPEAKMTLPKRTLGRAVWLWETEAIQSSASKISDVVAFCKKLALTEIFVQVPYAATEKSGVWEIDWAEDKIRPFIKALNKIGVKVHALDGDPSFALEKNHGRQIALIERIIDYNRKSKPEERFAAVRFDDEPYLLPDFYGFGKEPILSQFVNLLKKSKILTSQAGLELGVDIPFWFDVRNEYGEWAAPYQGGPVMLAVLDIVDNIGIMDYRTTAYGADGVIAHAEEKLFEAHKRGKRVFVGLETVPLPNETIYEFKINRPSSQSLVLTTLADNKIELTLVDTKLKGGQKGLGLWRTSQIPSSKSTFHNLAPEDLKAVMQQSESELSSYGSFAGIVIHSFESLVPFLKLDLRRIRPGLGQN